MSWFKFKIPVAAQRSDNHSDAFVRDPLLEKLFGSDAIIVPISVGSVAIYKANGTYFTCETLKNGARIARDMSGAPLFEIINKRDGTFIVNRPDCIEHYNASGRLDKREYRGRAYTEYFDASERLEYVEIVVEHPTYTSYQFYNADGELISSYDKPKNVVEVEKPKQLANRKKWNRIKAKSEPIGPAILVEPLITPDKARKKKSIEEIVKAASPSSSSAASVSDAAPVSVAPVGGVSVSKSSDANPAPSVSVPTAAMLVGPQVMVQGAPELWVFGGQYSAISQGPADSKSATHASFSAASVRSDDDRSEASKEEGRISVFKSQQDGSSSREEVSQPVYIPLSPIGSDFRNDKIDPDSDFSARPLGLSENMKRSIPIGDANVSETVFVGAPVTMVVGSTQAPVKTAFTKVIPSDVPKNLASSEVEAAFKSPNFPTAPVSPSISKPSENKSEERMVADASDPDHTHDEQKDGRSQGDDREREDQEGQDEEQIA